MWMDSPYGSRIEPYGNPVVNETSDSVCSAATRHANRGTTCFPSGAVAAAPEPLDTHNRAGHTPLLFRLDQQEESFFPNLRVMAEPVVEAPASAVEATVDAVVNATAGRQPSTPEGMAMAYGSLVIMALIPIVIGSYRSVKHHKEQKVSFLRRSGTWVERNVAYKLT